MSENKTTETDADTVAYLEAVTPEWRRQDAVALDTLFRDETGWEPRMWGGSIMGYGRYHYEYRSGREGDFLATGFAPRTRNFSIYILPGYAEMSDLLKDLGAHKKGKACLYVTRLSKIDLRVLRKIIRRGLDDLSARWEVHPS